MKDYLNEINDSFPIRRTNEEKSSFFEYVSKELGYERVKKLFVLTKEIEACEMSYNKIFNMNVMKLAVGEG